MRLETKVFSIENIDFDEVTSLHRAAFTDVLNSQDSERIHQPEYFRWKWSSPERSGLIAVVRDQSKYVSMNAMTWNWLVSKSQSRVQKKAVWLSCDTATHPEYRGQGFFRQCLETLAKEIRPDEGFAGFPNAQSLPGFTKFGWQSLASMNTYLKPILPSWTKKKFQSGLQETRDFQDFTFLTEGEQAFSRSPDWLKWRYLDSPKNPYRIYQIGEGPSAIKFVVRKYQRRGLRFLVLMDWSGARSDSLEQVSEISGTLGSIGESLDCQFLFVQASLRPFYASVLKGWIQVPDFFLPKKQIFAGHFPEGLLLPNLKMDLKLGDWDGL